MGRSEFDYSSPRPAWNAGRKVEAKRPLKPRQIGLLAFIWIESIGFETERYSTSQSIESYEAAIW